jgi:hypothetical protein
MSDDSLRELAAQISEFHITDRAMLRAQRALAAALDAGPPTEGDRAAYLREADRYFSGFEREARSHLRDVDRRLEHLNQVIFNLKAERAVAVKRIEATQGVLSQLRALREPLP